MDPINLKNLHDLFVYSTEHFSTNKAFYTLSGEGYKYNEFREKTEHVANLIHYCGLTPGDKIAILSQSISNWPVAFFSITAFDKVAVPLLPLKYFPANSKKHLLSRSNGTCISSSWKQIVSPQVATLNIHGREIYLNNP